MHESEAGRLFRETRRAREDQDAEPGNISGVPRNSI